MSEKNKYQEFSPPPLKWEGDIPPPMPWEQYEKLIKNEWNQLLESEDSKKERKIQQFLEKHPSMLPGAFGILGSSNLNPFPLAVITQPKLQGNDTKISDFLWISSDSTSVYLTFIELKVPTKLWWTEKGKPRSDLTSAINQLTDLYVWLEKPVNRLNFFDYFRIPELLRKRRLKQIYVLIYGRRAEAIKYENRDKSYKDNVILMTYDRLSPDPNAKNFMTVKMKKEGYEAVAIPPSFTFHQDFIEERAIINSKEKAIKNNEYLTKERKNFLLKRFVDWDEKSTQNYLLLNSEYEE